MLSGTQWIRIVWIVGSCMALEGIIMLVITIIETRSMILRWRNGYRLKLVMHFLLSFGELEPSTKLRVIGKGRLHEVAWII